MPDASVSPLVVAHQLGEGFERSLPDPPPGISWRRLPPEAAWEVPEEAHVLVLAPPRAGMAVATPPRPPAAWPRGLRWIHSMSAGVDEYPRWIFEAPVVTCGRGANSVSVAEFVLAGLLAVEKKLPAIWIARAEDWRSDAGLGTLQGKTLGLVGYGSIGQAVAVRALAFGMTVVAARRSANSGTTAEGVRFAPLETVLDQADHLVIAAPLTPETEGLVGAAALARLKPGAHLMNVSRGKVLDQDALIAALDEGRLAFASLDVTDPEPLPAGHRLYGHARVHLSPHVSGVAGGTRPKAAAILNANLRRFLAGEPLQGVVRPDLGY
jgi:phosphoglycerate dehydrogenase-like enzyme